MFVLNSCHSLPALTTIAHRVIYDEQFHSSRLVGLVTEIQTGRNYVEHLQVVI